MIISLFSQEFGKENQPLFVDILTNISDASTSLNRLSFKIASKDYHAGLNLCSMNILREEHAPIEQEGKNAAIQSGLVHFGFHSRRVKGSVDKEFLSDIRSKLSSK